MSILKLSIRNILSRPQHAILTLIMLSMGVALGSVLLRTGDALSEGFKKSIKGIDMVVGAKGSPLQLILSAVYQIDSPTGNIDLEEANKLARNPMVKSSVQLSYGDSYHGRRIVGTSAAYLDIYDAKIDKGAIWINPFDAVLGAQVASEFDLGVGTEFFSSHGLDGFGETHEGTPFLVTGILAPTGTVLDRLILTPPESIWDAHHDEADSTAKRQITAMLLSFRNKIAMMSLPRMVNQQTSMQAALPAIEINRLFELFGLGISTLQVVALVILLLGGISIFVSMVSALKDRAYELALIRSFGATAVQVFALVILEALIIALVGAALGIILAHSGIYFLNAYANSEFGILIDIWSLQAGELILIAIILILSLVAALFPAWRTTQIDVSKVLTDYAN